MQAAMLDSSGPLSPSSYLDFTTMEDGSSSAVEENSNAMDLLRYYLDMQQSQSSAALQTPTINMSEIEHQQQQQQQPTSYNGNSLFPFADASPVQPSAPSPPALPPSAFAAGSELPLQMDPSIWASFMPAAFNQTQTQPKVEEEEDTEPPYTGLQQLPQMSAPEPIVSATTGGNSKKRARSSQPIETIQEDREEDRQSDQDDEDDDDNEDVDDEHNDASFGSTTRSTRSGQRKANGRAAPAATSTTSNGKRGVSVSSSTTSSAPVTRPSKKVATSSSSHAGGQSHPHALVPVPEWDDKLSKAEYDKLSSKEKRQMRNKISARNFRHRRKAHIDTLEAEINDKNVVIGVLQNEVGALRTENTDLRADIEMLKKNWESIAAKISMASAPAAPVASTSAVPSVASSSHPALSPDEDDLYGAPSLPALSPPSSSASTNGDMETELSFGTAAGDKALARPSTSTSASASTSSSVRRTTRNSSNNNNTHKQAKPNLRKDLSSATGNGFWDSSSPFSSSFRGFGAAAGGMDVHTTFVPDLSSSIGSPIAALSEKRENGLDHFGSNTAFGQRQQLQPTQSRNMNPALNSLSQEQINNLREQFGSSSAFGAGAGSNNRNNTIDSRDRARLLAGKDALSSSEDDNNSTQSSFFEANPFLLLRGDAFQEYRGQLYSKLANNAAGIASSQSALKAGLSSPPEGLKPAFFATAPSTTVVEGSKTMISEAQMAGVAAIAQKTLFEKLSTAFWDAFSGQQQGVANAGSMLRGEGSKQVDGQKVADVLSGKSRLEVVSNNGNADEKTGLEEALENLALEK